MKKMKQAGLVVLVSIAFIGGAPFSIAQGKKAMSDISRIRLDGIPQSASVNKFGTIGIKFHFRLKNDGHRPMFLLDQKLTCSIAEISHNPDDFSTDADPLSSKLARQYLPQTSYFMTDKAWGDFRTSIDLRNAPGTLFSVLENQPYVFEQEFGLPIPRINMRLSGQGRISAADLFRDVAPFYVRFERCNFNGIVLSLDKKSRLAFLRKLSRRWRTQGHLLLDDFSSEPILVTPEAISVTLDL